MESSLADAMAGVTVLDLSRLLPGPYATMVMADLGATVIKIEDTGAGDYFRHLPPLSDGVSAAYLALNRNKRSVALDLKRDEDKAKFWRLLAEADVVVESFRPGVMDRLGLGYAALAARKPGIVLCSLSGYGQDSPYRDRAGHDLNYVALSGLLGHGESRWQATAPQVLGGQIADVSSALWTLSGVLAALLRRSRDGRGAHLDISMTESALALLAGDFAARGGQVVSRPEGASGTAAQAAQSIDGLLTGQAASYHVYLTQDRRALAVAALEPKFFATLMRALDEPLSAAGNGAGSDPGSAAGSQSVSAARTGATPAPSTASAPTAALPSVTAPGVLDAGAGVSHERLAAVFATRTLARWLEVFARLDCCVEPVLTLDEVMAHPQFVARGVFAARAAGNRAVVCVKTPLAPARIDTPAPTQGQHTAELTSPQR